MLYWFGKVIGILVEVIWVGDGDVVLGLLCLGEEWIEFVDDEDLVLWLCVVLVLYVLWLCEVVLLGVFDVVLVILDEYWLLCVYWDGFIGVLYWNCWV